MQAFRQQPRVLIGRRALRYPGTAIVALEFAPLEPFGSANEGSADIFGPEDQSEASCLTDWDSSFGRLITRSAIDPIPLSGVGAPDLAFVVEGNMLRLEFEVRSEQQLIGILRETVEVVPRLISVYFRTAVVVGRVTGRVDGIGFQWSYEMVRSTFRTTTSAQQVERVRDSVRLFRQIDWGTRPALSAALHYLHTAVRLQQVSSQAWEFLPEALLNLNKTLEALFGEDREHVRESLSALGFSKDVIEGHFIPVMLLRNEFDVGHALMPGRFDESTIYELSSYVHAVVSSYRRLLHVILDDASQGTTRYDERPLRSSKAKSRLLAGILEKVRVANLIVDPTA